MAAVEFALLRPQGHTMTAVDSVLDRPPPGKHECSSRHGPAAPRDTRWQQSTRSCKQPPGTHDGSSRHSPAAPRVTRWQQSTQSCKSPPRTYDGCSPVDMVLLPQGTHMAAVDIVLPPPGTHDGSSRLGPARMRLGLKL